MVKNNMKALVIFDTNFLIIPSKFKIDIFEKCEKLFSGKQLQMAAIDKTVSELKQLGSKRTRDSVDARVALKLIEAKKLQVINTDDMEYADNSLVNIEDFIDDFDGEIYVATMDAALRKRLNEARIGIITLRKKSVLQILS